LAATSLLPRRRHPLHWSSPLTYVLAIAVAAVSIGPVVYVILGGFRTTGQIAVDPAGLPHPWVWSTYSNVLQNSKFWYQLRNSGIIAGSTTIGVVVLGVLAAFVLARYTFRGREAIYTYFLEKDLSKRRILELYLNVIEWGDGIYGAEAASRTYFKKSASDLTKDEAAFLSAMIPSPLNIFNPAKNRKRVVRRQRVIARYMNSIKLDY